MAQGHSMASNFAAERAWAGVRAAFAPFVAWIFWQNGLANRLSK